MEVGGHQCREWQEDPGQRGLGVGIQGLASAAAAYRPVACSEKKLKKTAMTPQLVR